MQNLCVTIKDLNDKFNDREAIIKDVFDGRVDAYVPDKKCNVDLDFDQVIPMKPLQGDDVRSYFLKIDYTSISRLASFSVRTPVTVVLSSR